MTTTTEKVYLDPSVTLAPTPPEAEFRGDDGDQTVLHFLRELGLLLAYVGSYEKPWLLTGRGIELIQFRTLNDVLRYLRWVDGYDAHGYPQCRHEDGICWDPCRAEQ